jgi:glycosyltransferase involved in cell wall biosynthesis
MAAELQRYYGPLAAVAVAPNAADAGSYRAGPKEPLIFAAGRLWDEAKNIAALDAIARQLPWPVYLAGDGYQPQGARLLGRLASPEMQSWYSRASIYALPAKYEPFGLSVLEAALSGCVLTLGDIPSLRENWDGAAIFVQPDDHDALRRALQILISDDETRFEFSVRAHTRALDFTPERMASRYLELYHTCAQSSFTTR